MKKSLFNTRRINNYCFNSLSNVTIKVFNMTDDPGLYFEDGERSIDYVLVYSRKALSNSLKLDQLEVFVQNLQRIGFEYESHTFSRDQDIRFVLLHLKPEIMMDYAISYKIELAMNSVLYKFRQPLFLVTTTFLTDPDKLEDLYFRAEETFLGDKPTGLTPSEKIFLTCEILKKNRFGETVHTHGLQTLLKAKTLKCVYPIHEGGYKWTQTGPLNNRQLLYEYWARPKRWYKEQPNNVIEKYLGTEYAFYYKWLGLYTTLLVIPCICSILVIIYGAATIYSSENQASLEICQSKMLMCPRCSSCKYELQKGLCIISHISYILSNTASTAFAIFISLWSTVVVELWKRIEATNQMKWNVKNMEQELSMRAEYKERAQYREIADGTLEPFVPLTSWLLRTGATLATIIITTGIIVTLTIFLRVFRMVLTRKLTKEAGAYYPRSNINHIVPQFLFCAFITFWMIVLQKIYYKIIFFITTFENPRTEMEFDNSYIYKCYLLDCINHYAALMYIGLMKGRFYTHPGEVVNSRVRQVFQELCLCSSCTTEMAIMHFTIWFIRAAYRVFTKLVIPHIVVKWKRNKYNLTVASMEKLKQWEADYLLNRSDRYLVAHEYLDTVIEYGFVTIFISSFPLAPICAFLTNIMHLRVDAYKTITLYRRPNARKVAKLVCWSKLLQATTYFGIITNAGMIAFNSDFVPKQLYKHYIHANLLGFNNFTLSAFPTRKVYSKYNYKVEEKVCYYSGLRDSKHYQLTLNHWWLLAIRFACLLAIEHFVFLIQGFLSYMIPDVPYSVKEEIAHQQKMRREQSMRDTETTFINKRKKIIKESERFVLLK